ncbi:ABC transporter substrate-binding protein [Amycolatopsis pithecellobii]|uniref:ABC transporter substrate-binding protein n=1 Tax=Amycolatopsis pithecellobii TaxID=664692 RepID=UPI0014076E4D|nr:ABC transporter substrate-binding protein [Amycolatopsis pithecellobii]
MLNLAMAQGPTSLDPAQFNTAFNWYWDLAYETPISMAPDGSLRPGLATNWGYVGDGNRVFDLTLRPDVKFSDGSPLTAQVVKANLDRNKEKGNQAASRWADKTVDVTGPLSVRITSEKPDPSIPWSLTSTLAGGHVVSDGGLNSRDQLGTHTLGAGPYVLDAASTVANDHYTYVPNPDYWNKNDFRYERVVIKVMPNLNSVLNAMKTGEIDAAPGDYTVAGAAKSARLTVTYQPSLMMGLDLLDRRGEIVPALGDVRVRQALNLAVNRDTISSALFGEYGKSTDQTVVVGQPGSLPAATYQYDPEKAKKLLADAGYGNGLTIPTLTTSYNGQSRVVQAIAADLQKVGVTLDLKNIDYASYSDELRSRKYGIAGIGFGTLPNMHIQGPTLYLPNAATYNPFKSADPTITATYDRAAGAATDQQSALFQQVQRQLVDQAWFVFVTAAPKFYFARQGITGLDVPAVRPLANATWIRPASGSGA